MSYTTDSVFERFVQQLANKLRVTVWTTIYLIWVFSSGKYIMNYNW